MQMATKPQINYIEVLLIDIGIWLDRFKRNAYLKDLLSRNVTYLDELTLDEAKTVISDLKRIKEQQLNERRFKGKVEDSKQY